MIKYLFVLLPAMAHTSFAAGQQQQIHDTTYRISLRANPLGLVDPFDSNISFGAEYAVTERISVAADISYIFFSQYLSEIKRTGGIIIRPGIRYYTSDKRNWFVEAVVFYKHAAYTMEGWLGKDCINNIPVYDQYQQYTFRKRVLGFNFQAGVQAPLNKDHSLRLEFYIGLGIREKWQDIKDEPGACRLGRSLLNNNTGDNRQIFPSFPEGIRLVYWFKKRK